MKDRGTDNFDYALLFTLKWEGGYVDDPDDPGGKTKYGVTERTFEYAKMKGIVNKESVKDIEKEDVEAIYKSLYWERLGCDRMPLWVAVLVFDTGVNQGLHWSGLHLQRALNDLKEHHKKAPVFALKEDGIIGPKTLIAVNAMTLDSLEEVKSLFIRLYCVNRDLRYVELVFKNKRLEKFLKGWFLRTSALQDFAESFLEV